MKKSIVILFTLIAVASCSKARSCCEDADAIIMHGGFCGNTPNKIDMNCSMCFMPLKEIHIEDGKLYTEDSPGYVFSSNPDEYCTGKMYVRNNSSNIVVPSAILCFQSAADNTHFEINGYLTLVSSGFLLLTIAVYMYLPQLRDLQGQCYMCMCISLALGYMTLGILQLSPDFKQGVCHFIGFNLYFWMLANFAWMNVICINMYRSIGRGKIQKSAERKQFFYYTVYGWSIPVVLLIITITCNYLENTYMSPGIGRYSCWFSGVNETWLFFYGPISLLIATNLILFVLSSRKLWSQNQTYEVSKLNKIKYRFRLCLKLFLLMGITWIFEVVSFANGTSHIIWTIMDYINCLQGVVIFLLLVVLRKRAIVGLAKEGVMLCAVNKLATKLSPDDDSEVEAILDDDEHAPVNINC